MPDFIVMRKEQWIQPVVVKNAKNSEAARERAAKGDYDEAYKDATFQCQIASDSWEVEKVKKK